MTYDRFVVAMIVVLMAGIMIMALIMDWQDRKREAALTELERDAFHGPWV